MKEENKISIPAAIVVAGFLVMVGLLINKMPAKDPSTKGVADNLVDESFTLEPVSGNDHIRGDITKAEAIVIEYSDTECPFCKSFHNIMIEVMKKYGDDVAWVYRHFPIDSLHSNARAQAEATECVSSLGGNDAFWNYLDMIFKSTPSNNGLNMDLLPLFAGQVGVDVDEFNKCLASGISKKIIERHLTSGTEAGLTGTPFSVIVSKDGTQIPLNGADGKKLFETLDSFIK